MKSIMLAMARRLQTKFTAFISRKVLTHGIDLHVGARTRIWAPDRVSVGDHVYIGKDVHIEANCRIGDFCLVANRVAIVGRHDHDFSAVGFPIRYSPWIGSQLHQTTHDEAIIEEDVWLGYASIILTGVRIGKGSVVAAGSVVSKDIPPYSIVAGVPAKVIGRRFKDQATIDRHEKAVQHGRFTLSERGYDHCVIKPGSTLD